MCSRRVAYGCGSTDPGCGTCRWVPISFGNSSITCSINRTHERVCSNTRANDPGPEGRKMTILDTREIQATPVVRPVNPAGRRTAAATVTSAGRRPGAVPELRCPAFRAPRTGAGRSHRSPRSCWRLSPQASPCGSGWWRSSAESSVKSAPVPDRLAVVQVQTGETLQQVAGRVAPDAPVEPGHRPDPRAQPTRYGRDSRRPDADRADRLTVRCER